VYKFFEVFTKRVKYNKADVTKQNAENTLPVNTQGNNIEQENIAKNKPWSAPHRQSHSGKPIVYPSAHKDLPLPATTPLTR
jgi:hypothetical protein